MKNHYASLFLGSALLLSGASIAQSTAKGSTQFHGFETVRPISGIPAQRGGGGPVNDDCSGATVRSLAVGGNVVINGDNTGGTDAEGFGIGSTWEAFTITSCANITVSYCGTTPAFGNFFLGLGDCPTVSVIGATSSSDCADGNLIIFYEGVPAGTYYVPVLVEDGSTGPYVMTITADACAAPPANDNCAGAISLTSSANCNAVGFTTAGASETITAVTCEGFTSPIANDVWFSFVCTSTEQTIGVVGTNAADAVIELFSGTCNNLTSLACADGTFPQTADETTVEQLDQAGLSVGTTYYFRVFDWGHASAAHNFSACVTEGSGNNVGIAEHGNANAAAIYPNPSTGSFNLSYSGVDGTATIEVLDVTGRRVYNEQAQMTAGSTYVLNLGNVAAGQYNLRLTVNGQRSLQSLMVR